MTDYFSTITFLSHYCHDRKAFLVKQEIQLFFTSPIICDVSFPLPDTHFSVLKWVFRQLKTAVSKLKTAVNEGLSELCRANVSDKTSCVM